MQLLNMSSSLDLTFTNGRTARAIRVQERAELPTALNEIGLPCSAPVLVIVGGASNLSRLDYQRLESLFVNLLAPLAEELGMVVVDGGTDAGVMQLMGIARSQINGSFPLVGVAPVGKIQIPGRQIAAHVHPLEPHHTHFVLVPGSEWGDESPWIAETASVLSQDVPSVTILMNGGSISLKDVQESIAEERLVVVIAGTGRLADQIAAAMQNPCEEQRTLAPVLETGYFKLFELSKSTVQLRAFLKRHFLQQRMQNNERLYPRLNA